jgi:hypothetical protein
MLSSVGHTAPKHARFGSIAVILDATRRRRLDLNEQTWQRASNAGSRVNDTEKAIAAQRRAKSATKRFRGAPDHHKSRSSSLEPVLTDQPCLEPHGHRNVGRDSLGRSPIRRHAPWTLRKAAFLLVQDDAAARTLDALTIVTLGIRPTQIEQCSDRRGRG